MPMIPASCSSRSQAITSYLLALKTEVTNYLNGEPSLPYADFYKMYGEAREYFKEAGTEELGISQFAERLPSLSKPSVFNFRITQAVTRPSLGVLGRYVGTSLLIASAPISLPYLLIHRHLESKIRLQLNRIYNVLEKVLWQIALSS